MKEAFVGHSSQRIRAQRDAARQLIGKRLEWRHAHDRETVSVEAITTDGMVRIVGYAGEFAPHLFDIVEHTNEAMK